LRKRNVYVGVITNADGRMREVLRDLEFPGELFEVDSAGKDLVVISEEEGVEKPDERIFEIGLERVNGRYGVGEVKAEESVHVGDELESDYLGAVRAGWRGLLVGREVSGLGEVVEYVDRNS
jgi:FMN phosphatase YigB (HAD superfamily)